MVFKCVSNHQQPPVCESCVLHFGDSKIYRLGVAGYCKFCWNVLFCTPPFKGCSEMERKLLQCMLFLANRNGIVPHYELLIKKSGLDVMDVARMLRDNWTRAIIQQVKRKISRGA